MVAKTSSYRDPLLFSIPSAKAFPELTLDLPRSEAFRIPLNFDTDHLYKNQIQHLGKFYDGLRNNPASYGGQTGLSIDGLIKLCETVGDPTSVPATGPTDAQYNTANGGKDYTGSIRYNKEDYTALHTAHRDGKLTTLRDAIAAKETAHRQQREVLVAEFENAILNLTNAAYAKRSSPEQKLHSLHPIYDTYRSKLEALSKKQAAEASELIEKNKELIGNIYKTQGNPLVLKDVQKTTEATFAKNFQQERSTSDAEFKKSASEQMLTNFQIEQIASAINVRRWMNLFEKGEGQLDGITLERVKEGEEKNVSLIKDGEYTTPGGRKIMAKDACISVTFGKKFRTTFSSKLLDGEDTRCIRDMFLAYLAHEKTKNKNIIIEVTGFSDGNRQDFYDQMWLEAKKMGFNVGYERKGLTPSDRAKAAWAKIESKYVEEQAQRLTAEVPIDQMLERLSKESQAIVVPTTTFKQDPDAAQNFIFREKFAIALETVFPTPAVPPGAPRGTVPDPRYKQIKDKIKDVLSKTDITSLTADQLKARVNAAIDAVDRGRLMDDASRQDIHDEVTRQVNVAKATVAQQMKNAFAEKLDHIIPDTASPEEKAGRDIVKAYFNSLPATMLVDPRNQRALADAIDTCIRTLPDNAKISRMKVSEIASAISPAVTGTKVDTIQSALKASEQITVKINKLLDILEQLRSKLANNPSSNELQALTQKQEETINRVHDLRNQQQTLNNKIESRIVDQKDKDINAFNQPNSQWREAEKHLDKINAGIQTQTRGPLQREQEAFDTNRDQLHRMEGARLR